jgi:hypothetical protein
MSEDVKKWTDTAARALAWRSGINFDRLPLESNRELWRTDARAVIAAFHVDAEKDGAMLTRVPDARVICPVVRDPIDVGFNNCRTAVLAGKVAV